MVGALHPNIPTTEKSDAYERANRFSNLAPGKTLGRFHDLDPNPHPPDELPPLRARNQWEISIHELDISEKTLGAGSYGFIYSATYKVGYVVW